MRLIRGAPGSGKTAQVFREFKEALRAGESELRIVVPTSTLVRHFQHELARDGVVFAPRCVVSLSRFLSERANGAEIVPDGLLRAIVRDALARLKFPEFASVAATEGMAATVIDTIDLFENAGATPEKLGAVRKLGPHAKPFEKLWRAVREDVRQRGFQMRGSFVREASANTQPARIWMDGFLNFSPVEREFLRTLVKVCDVTLTIPDGAAGEEIRRFAMQLNAKDCLLSGGSRRKPQSTLASARTLEREADEIARRILEMHAEGTEFRNMGAALRDAATYVPLLKGTFERFGVPARFYFSTPLRKHPAAIFMNGLITGALGGWDFEPAIESLRAHPRWGMRADFDRFEFKVREAMPNRGAEALLALCESEWLRKEIAGCLEMEAWTGSAQRPGEWQRRLRSLAENVYRPGVLEVPGDFSAIECARSHVAGLRSWIAALESTTAFWLDANQPIMLADYWSVVSVAVESAVVRPMDDRSNVVHVMDVHEARQWDIACLFVCGLTDRDFPRQHAANLLFPDSDIERLQKAGIPLRNQAAYALEEQWLLDSLQTRATDFLCLSYPEHDASGKSVQRSRLIDFNRKAEAAALCMPAPVVEAPRRGVAGRVGDGELQGEMARLHQSISLTSLEDLAQCRFKFYGSRTLLLKGAPERPGERLQPRLTGSILHVTLERWLADRTQDFVEVFEAVFDEICRKERVPAGYRMEMKRIEFREIARRASASDLWQPESSEMEVPLTIQFPGGIEVKGRVDRIDRWGNDCVIVDYKSSKVARVKELVNSRTRLQGPLYALGARENLGLNPVAMVFWAVREDERFGWGEIPGADLGLMPIPENWTTEAKARTVERLAGFLGGQVHAHPEDLDQCQWCDLAAACRVTEQAPVQIGTAAPY